MDQRPWGSDLGVEVMSAPKKSDWWYSLDGKRGFCFGAVKGFDYKTLAQNTVQSCIYLYLDGGIMHLNGGEADTVYVLVSGKTKT